MFGYTRNEHEEMRYSEESEEYLRGITLIKSDPEFQRKNHITFVNPREYHVWKWGGESAKKTFKTPFDWDIPLDFREFDPELRKANSVG